jgi:P-type E1-E2 ATPase
VAVGSASWLAGRGYESSAGPVGDHHVGAGQSEILVGVDGRVTAVLVMGDRLREDADDLVTGLRETGIQHVAVVTGDREAIAEDVGRRVGVDRVYGEQSPEDKLEVVRTLQTSPELRPVVMVGDGINDAPALALADVGIAMGAAGATVSSETADAVIVVDRVERVAEALRIGRRSLGIARESVLVGIGLSLVAMCFAAFGFIAPVAGALLQEVIDVAVILNALRALRA